MSRCGEVVIRRRLYKDKKTSESRFLLDEALGMGGRERITPGLKEMLVSLATEVTSNSSHLALNALDELMWLGKTGGGSGIGDKDRLFRGAVLVKVNLFVLDGSPQSLGIAKTFLRPAGAKLTDVEY